MLSEAERNVSAHFAYLHLAGMRSTLSIQDLVQAIATYTSNRNLIHLHTQS